jgi:predicted lipoprotein with Yx(FWY)xxD motif
MSPTRRSSVPWRAPRRLALLLVGAASASAFIACGGASASKTLGAQPERATRSTAVVHSRPPRAALQLRTAASRYGQVLVDHRGRALYLFTRDAGSRSACSGACARAWPPYLVSRRGRGSAGARSSLIGVTRRGDGSHQLTYAGHPLYYYVGDRSPGQILCQDVEEYGGHWWVVSPAGRSITAAG